MSLFSPSTKPVDELIQIVDFLIDRHEAAKRRVEQSLKDLDVALDDVAVKYELTEEKRHHDE